MNQLPGDLYENLAYWQEYECPSCMLDLDVSPIPRKGAMIKCGCGQEWPAYSHEPNAYVVGGDGYAVCINHLLK